MSSIDRMTKDIAFCSRLRLQRRVSALLHTASPRTGSSIRAPFVLLTAANDAWSHMQLLVLSRGREVSSLEDYSIRKENQTKAHTDFWPLMNTLVLNNFHGEGRKMSGGVSIRREAGGLAGIIRRIASVFAPVSVPREYIEVEVAGQRIEIERIMPTGFPPNEITVVLPHVEIRRLHGPNHPQGEIQEVILESITVVSSPQRGERQIAPSR